MRRTLTMASHLLLGVAVAVTAACSAGSGTGPSAGTEAPDAPEAPGAAVSGSYTLKSVNNHALPTLLWDDHTAEGFGAQMYILSGSIVLRVEDSSFTSTDVSKLAIEGVGEQVWTSTTNGKWMFVYNNEQIGCDPSECGWAGEVRLTGENGAHGTMYFTGGTLSSTAMIPGAPGQTDLEVFKQYER
jgi:hypothetical protein